MRYHIDTIPVWDSAKLDGECLLCALRRKTELGEADRYLGASVMEPDTRIQVNKLGFCTNHQVMLFGASNRLGHALMMESHLKETRDVLRQTLEKAQKAANAYSSAPLAKITKAGAVAKKDLTELADQLAAMGETCIMCKSIEENMNRYLHTFFHLMQNDTEFAKKVAASKGFCLPHTAQLLRMAPQELPAKAVGPFVSMLTELQNANFDRMQEDLSWFIKKFDYRFLDEPWKNSQDAVPRTVNKLRGWCVGDEPNPKEK